MTRKIFSFFRNALALLVIFVVLVIPNRLSDIYADSFFRFPLEFLLLGLLLLIPGTTGKALRWLAASVLAVGLIFKIADMATFNIFARPFNPVFDAYLLVNGMDLLNGAVGKVAAVLIVAMLIVVSLAIIVLAFLLMERVRKFLAIQPKAGVLALLVLVSIWGLLWLVNSPRLSTQFYDQLAMHVINTRTSINDMRDFKQLLVQSDEAKIPDQGLFETLQGKDVLVIFIESYGRTALDKPEFAEHIRPLLQAQADKLKTAGIGVRSAYFTSPTVGGLSWLAHGTAMSGLWVNSQVRYDSLVMSKRESLNRLFHRAGWRAIGVMPAITLAWPEGDYYGYDYLYHAYNLGYEGKPFNWITMPDQFTLSALQRNELDRNELDRKNRSPVMAEIALISSHAPWTPVPELVDWNQVGNGEIFNEQATRGDSPETVWKNPERIRLQFRLSIEYTLHTVVDYVLKYGDENLVVMAFGDHQPAPLVTGDSDNRDVPVHFFARDPKILDAIAGWNWAEGMIPADTGPVWTMDQVRERFITTFSAP